MRPVVRSKSAPRTRKELHGAVEQVASRDRVERGGCRLEFAGGQVDATIATRWNRVMAQLERGDAWLE